MYSVFSSCLMQCCPHAGVLFVPILRPPRPQNDDEFEKYEPRPKIVIEKRDFELSRPYYNGAMGESFEPTVPSLRISAQHVNQKDAVIVKIISLHGCSLLVDDATQVRLSVSNQKTKHQTAIARGQEPVFNQTFTITGLNRDTLLSSTLRFRVYSRTGKSRMNLRAEGTLEDRRRYDFVISVSLGPNRVMKQRDSFLILSNNGDGGDDVGDGGMDETAHEGSRDDGDGDDHGDDDRLQ
ncbi:unnamed protein product [Haemonchus placei]|uniref:C2 domain-containing protein n=1 Tax=Haemonchus placei TaxID=6290 RepID=A0A0N4WCQ3_HAEPC|nr:unnamed protein product [Haemonchus placei]